jgi:Acyl-CoA dehydrogenases
VLVVMAVTPPKIVNGRERKQITAFIVDVDWPGVEITYRCRFMGLRALYNGIVKFTNVRVPRENMIAKEGQGLKVALTTLNTGRLTIPAACVGLSSGCSKFHASGRLNEFNGVVQSENTQPSREKFQKWRGTRSRWRRSRFSRRDWSTARRAICELRPRCARCGRRNNLENFGRRNASARRSRLRNGTILKGRGEPGIPVERFLRDCRINTIFEGSSEIMRLFIAREALDPHLKVGGAIFQHHVANV